MDSHYDMIIYSQFCNVYQRYFIFFRYEKMSTPWVFMKFKENLINAKNLLMFQSPLTVSNQGFMFMMELAPSKIFFEKVMPRL